jgi:membrane-associated protease RseP (regulator of RpoE activity)
MESEMKKLWLLLPVLLLLTVTRGTADSGILPSGLRTSVVQEKPGAWLGVRISATVRKAKDGDTEKTERRVIVEDVVDGSPAEKAGIEDGDVLVAFNNVAIGEPKDLTDALKKLKEGDKATVTVLRGGEQKTLDVVLGAPKARKAIVSKSIRVPRPPRIPAAPWAGVFPGRSMFGGHAGYGLTIETLGPQLAEYFGVHGGKGALIKSVKSGSDGREGRLQGRRRDPASREENRHQCRGFPQRARGL